MCLAPCRRESNGPSSSAGGAESDYHQSLPSSLPSLLGSGRAVEAIPLDSIGIKKGVWYPFLKRALKIL